MSDLKKYIIYRTAFIVGLIVLTYLCLYLFEGDGQGFFSVKEVFLLTCLIRILPLTIVLGIIDLIVLGAKNRFSWAKFFSFIIIEIILFAIIILLIN